MTEKDVIAALTGKPVEVEGIVQSYTATITANGASQIAEHIRRLFDKPFSVKIEGKE